MRALVVEKDAEGKTSASVQNIDEARLPAGEVTVAVAHSTVNYKDGLCIGPGGGLVRAYPHVPGIDFAGTVTGSDDPRYRPGDRVILTGWRVGETQWGGYAEKARVAVRNVRRHSRQELERLAKDGELSDDELARIEKELDKVTHDAVTEIDAMLGHKEQELLEV